MNILFYVGIILSLVFTIIQEKKKAIVFFLLIWLFYIHNFCRKISCFVTFKVDLFHHFQFLILSR